MKTDPLLDQWHGVDGVIHASSTATVLMQSSRGGQGWVTPSTTLADGRFRARHDAACTVAAGALSTPARRFSRGRELRHGAGIVFPSQSGRMQRNGDMSDLKRELRMDAVPHGFRSSFRDWARMHRSAEGGLRTRPLASGD